jgi:uncharacterized protein (DUF983 family)
MVRETVRHNVRCMNEQALDFDAPRSVWSAMTRGMRNRCPNCGLGRLLFAFVKVNDQCETCHEAMHHHRADDMPPYVTILIVGHIIVPLVLMVEQGWAPETWVHWLIWLPLTVALSLLLLPRIKGAVIGIQWANRMHGFGGEEDLPVGP